MRGEQKHPVCKQYLHLQHFCAHCCNSGGKLLTTQGGGKELSNCHGSLHGRRMSCSACKVLMHWLQHTTSQASQSLHQSKILMHCKQSGMQNKKATANSSTSFALDFLSTSSHCFASIHPTSTQACSSVKHVCGAAAIQILIMLEITVSAPTHATCYAKIAPARPTLISVALVQTAPP